MASLNPGTGEICSRCSKYDFTSIFDSTGVTDFPRGRALQPSIDLCKADLELASCPVCRLFATVRNPEEIRCPTPRDRPHLRAYSVARIYGIPQNKFRTALRKCAGVVVHNRDTLRMRMKGGPGHYGLIVPLAFPEIPRGVAPFDFLGNLVNANAVDFNAVSGWLSQCTRQHEECSAPVKGHLPRDFRVIDCDTLEVVSWSAISGCHDYFALSYVWSEADRSSPRSTRTGFCTKLVESALSQTAVDAIMVVRKLRAEGHRYLWIDRYCINQLDVHEKHDQIKAMDIIYEGAFAAIIAASKRGSEAGLPGMGFSSRAVQPSAFVNGLQLVSTLPHVSAVLEETTWVKRGWTYQEAILSRRCLIFTDVQVYFVCLASTYCEAVIKHPGLHDGGEEFPQRLFRQRKLTKTAYHPDELQRFANHVESYSRRVLSYDEDGLNAFRGILARASLRTYWGVPIVEQGPSVQSKDPSAAEAYSPSFDKAFASGLCWYVPAYSRSDDKSYRRRKGLPSWSWVGWTGNVLRICHFPYSNSYPITFYIETGGNERPLQKLADLATATSGKVVPEQSIALIIQASVVNIRFQPTGFVGTNVGSGVRLCDANLDTECRVCATDDPEEIQSHGTGTNTFDLYHASGKHEDAFNRLWEALLLASYATGSGMRVRLLVIEWHGESAERIGLLDAPFDEVDRLPRTMRSIRLV